MPSRAFRRLATLRLPEWATSALVAVLLTIVAFPEVVFLGGSLSTVGLAPAVNGRTQAETVHIYPSVWHGAPQAGLADVGARNWQHEPAIRFMRRSLTEGESFEWNPYSGGGMVGPETLADLKLAPLTLAVAALGASSLAFTVVMLLLVVLDLYCLQQFFLRVLGTTRMAAIAAAAAFLFNGWVATELSSQVAAPYFLFPIVLYALTAFLRRPAPARLLVAAVAYSALFATTFLPSVILVLIVVHVLALVFDWTARSPVARSAGGEPAGIDISDPAPAAGETPAGSADEVAIKEALREPLWRRSLVAAGRQVVVPVFGLGLTAFIWFPVADALRHVGSEFDSYEVTSLTTRDPLDMLGAFTPTHVFTWWHASSVPDRLKPVHWAAYLGLASVLLILAALPRATGSLKRMLITSSALCLAGTLLQLGVPVVSWLAWLPGLRQIDQQYFGGLAGAGLVITLGCAIEVARRNGLSFRVAATAGGVLAGVFLLAELRIRATNLVAIAGLTATAMWISATLVLVWLLGRWPARRVLLVGSCVALAGVELLSYGNHLRTTRTEVTPPPAYLAFLMDNLNGQRAYNGGRSALQPDWGSAFGVRQIETINLMQSPWYRTFFEQYINPEKTKFLMNGVSPEDPFTAKAEALDLLGVRYLVVHRSQQRMEDAVASRYDLVFEDDQAGVDVYENRDAFPRAFLSTALTDTHGEPPWLRTTATTSDRQLMDEAAAAGIGRLPATDHLGSIEITEDHNARVAVGVEADRPAVLVLTDNYHENWTATVNGPTAHIGRVDDIARGVVVPAGPSTVVFEYHSTARSIGTVVSAATALALLMVAAIWTLRRHRSKRSANLADGAAPLIKPS